MADQPITTSIDSLVKYLKEHGETDTTTLSRVLSVNEGTIVDWADILEKAGMVKIVYKVGKMYLSPSGTVGPPQTQVEKAVGDVKKTVIENELRAQDDILNDVRSKIEIYARTVKNAETIFKEKGGEAKMMLDKITVMEREANKYYNEVNTKHENVTKMVDSLDKEIKSLESDADQIRQFNLNTSGAKGVLDDIANRITIFNNSMSQMNKEFERTVTEQRNQLKATEESIRAEINVLKDTANAENKRISDYDRKINDYRRKADTEAKKASRTRAQMLDDAIKTRDEVLGIYSAASAQFRILSESIKNMKDSWGLLAVFNDKIAKVSAGIDDLSRQLDKMEKELTGTSNALKDPKIKQQEMKDLEVKSKSMRNATNTLSKKGEKIRKDLEDISK